MANHLPEEFFSLSVGEAEEALQPFYDEGAPCAACGCESRILIKNGCVGTLYGVHCCGKNKCQRAVIEYLAFVEGHMRIPHASVSVPRSNGSIDSGWTVDEINLQNGRAHCFKEEELGRLTKCVPLESIVSMNPDFMIDLSRKSGGFAARVRAELSICGVDGDRFIMGER